MDVRIAEVNDQVEQAIFEIYAILALRTTPKYNEFRTTYSFLTALATPTLPW